MLDNQIKGPIILLYSGNYFNFLEPEKSNFTIEDIAHALSMTCRFGGHCDRFYSVAEHCVLASWAVENPFKYDALMHDAAEAFTGDFVKPLKDLLPDFKVVEHRIENAVFNRFGVTTPLALEVKEIDVIMLATEQRFLTSNKDRWYYTYGYEPMKIQLPCWSPEQAKKAFLYRYNELSKLRDRYVIPRN